MKPTTVLNLDTDRNRTKDVVVIDGAQYELRHRDDLKLADLLAVDGIGQRMRALSGRTPVNEDLEAVAADLATLMTIVLAAPTEVLERLTLSQQMRIADAFAKRPDAPAKPRQRKSRQK